nr:hypothetical protein [Tanacetum cinerariifolium]
MEHSNTTPAKILILDIGKFEQWKFKIQQYLQHKHSALWEVIEFGDSYEVPKEGAATGTASDGKKGRTIAITTEDMQKRRNDVKVYESEVQKKSNSQNMAFISSSKNSSGNEEVNTASVPTASTQVSPAGANVSPASISLDTACVYIASQSNGSQIKYEDINQIDEDDIEEMDIKWNMALLSMRADRYWKKTGKKISIQGTDVAGFDKSKVKCFNCHKMGHFARECRAPRSQERGRRYNYRQGSKVEEHAPKALMVIDGVACKKNIDSLNSQITELSEKLGDIKNMFYHYKLGLSQVEARLVEFKNQEIKFCEKIRGLEFSVECKANRIENLTNELETLKKEKEGLDSKLSGFKSSTKDLDNLIGSQRSDKNKEGLLEFADDIITDYTRPSASVESNPNDLQNNGSSVFKIGESTGNILFKLEIKFVKATDSLTVVKTDKKETVRKPAIKYAKLYRKTSKKSNVRGNQRNWNNLKSQQLGKNFAMKKACYNYGGFDHLSYDCGKWMDHGRTWGNSQIYIDDKGYWDSG